MSRQITYEGVTYPTITACAKALGLTRASVYRGKMEKENGRSRKVIAYNDRVGLKVTYPSMVNAATMLGVSMDTLRRRLEDGKWIFGELTVKVRYA